MRITQNKVKQFIKELAEVQAKYGMFITNGLEEALIVSKTPFPHNHEVLCYTNSPIIEPLSEEGAEFDPINVEVD